MENIAIWLKETIPGIIILGAVGSIVAVFLLKVLKKTLVGILPDIKRLLQELVDWWLDHPFESAIELFGNAKPYAVHSFFAFELAKLIVTLVASCTLAIFFLITESQFIQWLSATFAFVFSRDALKAFLRIFSYAIIAKSKRTSNLLKQIYGEEPKDVDKN